MNLISYVSIRYRFTTLVVEEKVVFVQPSVAILSLNAYYSEVSSISVDTFTSNVSCSKSTIASINCFSLMGTIASCLIVRVRRFQKLCRTDERFTTSSNIHKTFKISSRQCGAFGDICKGNVFRPPSMLLLCLCSGKQTLWM